MYWKFYGAQFNGCPSLLYIDYKYFTEVIAHGKYNGPNIQWSLNGEYFTVNGWLAYGIHKRLLL